MRISTIGTPVVRPPEPGMEVEATRGVRPIDPRTPGAAAALPRPAAEPAVGVAAVEQAERRREARRSEDRRKRQVAVLIDTRVAERRTLRRRGDDAAPPSIDVSA
jgi:hypothetical protein